MTEFTITVEGIAYTSRDEAIAAVRDAWDAWKSRGADPRIGSNASDYLRFKADTRPPGYEPTDAERESFAARLAEADMA
jgi:hypothetical protein